MSENEVETKIRFEEACENNDLKVQDPWTRSKIEDDDNFDEKKDMLTESQRKMSVYHKEAGAANASFYISVFNLMNAVLGSGILGLAYAMSQLGIVLFFILLTFVAILCLFAIHLLLCLCEQTNVKSYEKLGLIAFGLPGKFLAAGCILLQNIGAMSSYLFIVKYELPNVLSSLFGVSKDSDVWWINGDILVIVVTLSIIMPLASLKNIGFLGYTSGFSICCMLFFTGVIIAKKFMIDCPLPGAYSEIDLNETYTSLTTSVYENFTNFIDNNTSNEHDTKHLYEEFGEQICEAKTVQISDKWPYSIPTMTFSFVCHTAVLPIYAELKEPTQKKMQKVSVTSIFICYILYSLAALFGYLTFYNWMEVEMLLMYSFVDSSDILTLTVRITVLLAVVLTVPLTHFPARKALTFLLYPDQDFKWSRHLGIMLVLLSLINVLVIFVPSIKDVFGIIGATASTMLVFVLPSIFFLKISKKPLKSKILALLMGVIGIGLMVESLTTIIIGYFK